MDDSIVERTESFQCTIKAVFSSQDVPILLDSDKSTALVIINDDDNLPLVFAGSSSVSDPRNRIVYTAYENVSTVPLRIVAYGTASFEFKVQLYVAQYIDSLPGQENATGEETFPFRIRIYLCVTVYLLRFSPSSVSSPSKLRRLNCLLKYAERCKFLGFVILFEVSSLIFTDCFTIAFSLLETSNSEAIMFILGFLCTAKNSPDCKGPGILKT